MLFCWNKDAIEEKSLSKTRFQAKHKNCHPVASLHMHRMTSMVTNMAEAS